MLRAGQIIQLVVIALLCLAVVMVTSAGMDITSGPVSLVKILQNKNAAYALAAVVAMFLASRIDLLKLARPRGWANPIYWVFGLSLALVGLTMVPHVGLTINGAHRWLRLAPGVTFQPSELVKWSAILLMAWWCTSRADRIHRLGRGLLPALAMLGLACVIIVMDDLGTATLVGVVGAMMLLGGGARLWQLGLVIPPAAAGLVVAIARNPYRLHRLTSFLDPWADPRGKGYQAIQSMLAIAQGGFWGRGLGNGIQKFGYLPTDTSDCLFAIICEELGMPGAALVVALYLVLIWCGLKIVRRCIDPFTRLVGVGVILTVGIQALINIAVVTVVVPTKGIALPLLSAGGTGWIVTAFALGLVAGLDRAPETQMSGEAAPSCGGCGYDLTGNISGACPECGHGIDAAAQAQIAEFGAAAAQ